MKRTILSTLIFASIFCVAQENVNTLELQRIAKETEQKYKDAKVLAEIQKRSANFPKNDGTYLGIIDGVPVYLSTDDVRQAKATDTDYLYNNTIPGVAVTGSGMTVYIWDGGRVRNTHQEFSNRVTNLEASTVDISSHSTGVAGVIMGEGVNANSIGMAYEASLNSYDYDNSLAEIATESANPDNSEYLISNHSYGQLTGWRLSPDDNNWYWYGYPSISENEAILFGFYSSGDNTWDGILYNAPQHIAIKSAGNDRTEGPAPGTPHYAFDDSSNWVYYENTIREKDCGITGYDCIPTSGGVSKNTITVGSINPITSNNGRYTQPSDVVAAFYSSFGPTDDGRIKPDLVAVGSNVVGPTSNSNSSYQAWYGTSFSAPSVSGIVTLLQQLYNETTTNYLRSDLAKALLIHTANEAGAAPGPDYGMGWGLVNSLNAAKVIVASDDVRIMENHTINNGESYSVNVTAEGNEPLKATIVWLDPAAPSTPINAGNLNNRTPKLRNDLDLRIMQGNTENFPWKLDPDNPADAATKGDNIVDNVEQVVIDSPTADGSYEIKVTHKGTNLVTASQNFALIVTGIKDNLGVDDVSLAKSVTIYPNPVSDKINLQSNINLTNAEVKVLNMAGQIILDAKYKTLNSSTLFDLSKYPSGEYLIYITSDQGKYSKLLLKK